MAGMMYLGNQKVTPVIVQGGSAEPTGCVFRVPDNVTEMSTNSQFEQKFYEFPYELKVDFNNVETVSGRSVVGTCFAVCNINELKENIKTISGERAFETAFGMATIPEESTIFENLEVLSAKGGLNSCFFGTNKKNFRFKKLYSVGTQSFEGCFMVSSVENIYFDSLKTSSFTDTEHPDDPDRTFILMLDSVDGCTVHFPSNLESLIGDGYYVLSGFGGTNTTVLFDLPETE